MNLKILIGSPSIFLLISCGTKKTASSANELPAQSPVTENIITTEVKPEIAEVKKFV